MKKKNDDRKRKRRASLDPTNDRRQVFKQQFPGGTPADKARGLAKELIRSLCPLACTLSVNFAHPYSDHRLLKWMDELVRHLNGAYFRNGYKKRKKGYHLKGICSIEVCRDGGRLDNRLHFHFLIQPTKTLKASNCLEKLLPKVIKAVTNIKDDRGRSISNEESVKVSPYFGPGNLASYYTKEFEERGDEAYDFLAMLGPEGLEGYTIPTNRGKGDLIGRITE